MEGKTNFSNVLKRYKEEHGLSYVEFAEDLGIAKSALENYINEIANPRLDTLEIVAKKLGMPVSELLDEKPSKSIKLHPVLEPVQNQLFQVSDFLYDLEHQLAKTKDHLFFPHIHFRDILASERKNTKVYLYIPFEETLHHPELGAYRSCGILVFKGKELLMFAADISTNTKAVISLAERCTKEQLLPIHFYDVIDDFLAD